MANGRMVQEGDCVEVALSHEVNWKSLLEF